MGLFLKAIRINGWLQRLEGRDMWAGFLYGLVAAASAWAIYKELTKHRPTADEQIRAMLADMNGGMAALPIKTSSVEKPHTLP
jgi:hypothetical protein